ncbi:MAG: ABC transporter permease [Bacteroidia bacterium]
MRKIFLLIAREYVARVRKRSFIVMTILAPLLFVLFYGIIIYFAINRDLSESKKRIYISDESGTYLGKFQSNKLYEFVYGSVNINEIKPLLDSENYYAVLLIPKLSSDNSKEVQLFYKEQPGFSVMNYLEEQMEREQKMNKLSLQKIDKKVLENINNTRVKIHPEKITSSGFESGNIAVSTILGFIGAFLIYLFIFMYGVQIMKGVIEEKTNRIVEILISSVKPFELMMGKIIGIALVGLTQFVIWILLIAILGGGSSGFLLSRFHLPEDAAQSMLQGNTGVDNDIAGMLASLPQFNFILLIGMFLFYFIGGYLFYGSLFAAVGSSVDNETDTQQFMLPLTLPLVFALVFAQSAVTANPNSPMAFWLSMIPFTSPVTMMVRIPFGVPTWQLILSMVLLTAGFIFTVWIAAKIYRVGILMYGKKPTYREIGKWLFYKG